MRRLDIYHRESQKKIFLKKRGGLQDSFLFEGFHSWPQRSEDLFFGKSVFTYKKREMRRLIEAIDGCVDVAR